MMLQPTIEEQIVLKQVNRAKDDNEIGELLMRLAEIHHEKMETYDKDITLVH